MIQASYWSLDRRGSIEGHTLGVPEYVYDCYEFVYTTKGELRHMTRLHIDDGCAPC